MSALALAGALLVGCGGDTGGDPPRRLAPSAAPTTAASTTSSPNESGLLVSDVRVNKLDDPVADVVWVLTYDARWVGEAEPGGARCVWRMRNADELTIVQGVVQIGEEPVDDAKAGDVYPDEIPGQPVTGTITCPSTSG